MMKMVVIGLELCFESLIIVGNSMYVYMYMYMYMYVFMSVMCLYCVLAWVKAMDKLF